MMQRNNAEDSNARGAVEVLLAEQLRKSYGPRPALKGLSFSLKAGRILGFLGPNGAGKTTAIRILTTILDPDSGKFAVDGISSDYPEKIRHRIGVLPESLGFHKHMTGIECLMFFGQLYGRPASEARTYGLALLEAVGLQQRAKSLVGTYSRGMRQRLGIARALINNPAVVFLDEPTLGLDPRGQQELLELVRWIASERNAGVVLCSHLLSEVESVCDDVIILSVGQVVACGTVTEVIGQAQPRLSGVMQGTGIRILVPPSSVAQAGQILERMPEVAKVTFVGGQTGWLRIELTASTNETSKKAGGASGNDGVPGDASSGKRAGEHLVNNRILNTLIQADIPILRFGAEGGRLQDAFLQLTEEVIA